jgi:hypothetical protein
MKYFKKMSAEDFGKYLLTVPFGKEMHFALDYSGWDCREEDIAMDQVFDESHENDFEVWYFIRGMEIAEYQSRFLLCDYAGGEEAFAMPVSSSMGKCKYPTSDDKEYIPRFWMDCWNNIKSRNGYDQQDYLFVEIIEED